MESHNLSAVRKRFELSLLYLVTITALPLFFLFDGVSKILYTYSFEFHRTSLIIRTIYELIFLILILVLLDKVRASISGILILLLIIFLASQLSLPYQAVGFFGENLIAFNKYIFVFIIYAALYKLKDDKNRLEKCISVVEILFVINSFAVLLGPITGWEFLKTYVNTDYRHGYLGFILSQNEGTMFYFLAVSLAYYKRYILGIPSYRFFVILLAALLLGTKGIYLFLFLLLIFHGLFYAKNRIFLILAVALLLFQSIRFATSEEGKTYLIYFYNENLSRNLFSMLLSGRDVLLKEHFLAQVNQWSFINYLVGGQNILVNATELDFFDLLLFFGLLGSTVYLALLFFTLFRFRKTKFALFFTLCFLILAFFGGHFFTSALNGIYLCLIAIYIYSTQNHSDPTSVNY